MGERMTDEEAEKELLRKARELDEMTRDVTSQEADVLERVLEAFRDGKKPKIKDCEKIETMYDKYLGQRDDGESADAEGIDGEYPEEEELDL